MSNGYPETPGLEASARAMIAAYGRSETDQNIQTAANRIMAAAPDMYQALVNLVGNGFTDEELATRWRWPIDCIQHARAAVAKAEGRANG